MSDRLFSFFIWFCALSVVVLLGWILGEILFKGFFYLSFNFLFSNPIDSGRAGGIASILISTFLVLLVALSVAFPFGICVAIWLSEFARKKQRYTTLIGTSLDVLAGVPSIVYGLFGNAFFCIFLGMGFSILSGGLTLACMILPIFIRTCESGLRAVENDWRLGGFALGMSQTSTIWHILLPAAKPAILAGMVLGIGRATAETAALIFTSGYVDRMPESLLDSGRVLSVHIYDLTMNVTGGNQAAYGSALVLIVLIILFNLLAQALVDRWFKRSFVHEVR